MKKVFIGIAALSFCIACGNSDSGTGDERNENMGTINEATGADTGLLNGVGDTTATTNNNVYNTDSASGQGNRYDTSNRNR